MAARPGSSDPPPVPAGQPGPGRPRPPRRLRGRRRHVRAAADESPVIGFLATGSPQGRAHAHRGVHRGAARPGLRRGPERRDRVPLRRQGRSTPGAGGRAGAPHGRRHPRRRRRRRASPRRRRRAPSRSSWPAAATRSGTGSSRAWRIRAETSPGCPTSRRGWLRNAWSCSGDRVPASSRVLVFSTTRARSHGLQDEDIRTGGRDVGRWHLASCRCGVVDDARGAFQAAASARADAVILLTDVSSRLDRASDRRTGAAEPPPVRCSTSPRTRTRAGSCPMDRASSTTTVAPPTYVDKILKGAEPGRPPDRAAHQVRLRHQPQDRPGARADHPASRSCSRPPRSSSRRPKRPRSSSAGALNAVPRPRILGHRPRPPIVRGARHGVPVVRRREPTRPSLLRRMRRRAARRLPVVRLRQRARREVLRRVRQRMARSGEQSPQTVIGRRRRPRRATPRGTWPRRSWPSRGPGGRAQAGHRPVRRRRRLDRADPRPRPRGRPAPARRRGAADDGRRPPLRGHRQPADGRRPDGDVRRSGRARGPRRSGLLRRPGDAGRRPRLRRGGAASARRGDPDPGRAEQRRGGRPADLATTCTWTTPRWARPSTWPRGWSSSPNGGTVLLTAETLALVEGYVQVRLARADAGQGASRARSRCTSWSGRARFGRASRSPPRAASPDSSGGRPSWRRCTGPWRGRGAGHGQVAALVGEPGVGKSRLVWEVTHSAPDRGLDDPGERLRSRTARPPPTCRSSTCSRRYCRIEARDDDAAIREKVTGKLLTLDERCGGDSPPLLALLDVPVDDAAWERLDPHPAAAADARRGQALLLRESQEQPLLLVFEDLHWIDAETQALLDSLVESLPTARILLAGQLPPRVHRTTGATRATTPSSGSTRWARRAPTSC